LLTVKKVLTLRLGVSTSCSLGIEMAKIEIRDRTPRDILLGQDSYILLFFLLIIDYLSLSLIDSLRWGGLLHIVPISVSVVLGMHTSVAKRGTIQIAGVVLGIAILAAVIQVINPDHRVGSVAFFLVAILLIITSLTIMRRVLRHRFVNIETLFGALDVYILIGLFFSTIFIGMSYASANHHGGPFFAQPGPHNASDYVYFSFIVLTTVGFGDLTPYTEAARSVVVLEALIGQIFLVTLVARLVTLFGMKMPHLAAAEEEPLPPSEISPDPFRLDEDPDPE